GPALPLCFGDVLDVFYVRSSLSEDVVKIVADADEGEAFVEKFGDSGGSEEEEAEDDTVFARSGNELFGGGAELGRGVHVRELVLFIQAHGHAEIILAEEEDIDAGNSGDFVDVLDAVRRFDLESKHDVCVGPAGIAKETLSIHAALREVDGAGTGGGIAPASDCGASLVGTVDVGDENAIGAEVKRLLDARTVAVAAHADEGLCADIGDATKHGRKFFVSHRPVLGVDEQPIVTAVRQLLRDSGGMRVQEDAEFGSSSAQLFFEFGACEATSGHETCSL